MFTEISPGTDSETDSTSDDTSRQIPLDTTDTTLVIAGCGEAKADSATEAKNMYTSGYFSLKRSLGEYADHYRIVSAEHGLLNPARVIEPYNTEWSDLSDAEQAALVSEIVSDLEPLLETVDKVIFLAGQTYRYPIIDALDAKTYNITIHEPFEATVGYQDQMSFMSTECDRLIENRA